MASKNPEVVARARVSSALKGLDYHAKARIIARMMRSIGLTTFAAALEDSLKEIEEPSAFVDY